MGARVGHYLPLGVKPDPTNDLISMFWNQYGLIWQRGPVNGEGEFLLTASPPPVSGAKDRSKTPCEIGMDFPEPGAQSARSRTLMIPTSIARITCVVTISPMCHHPVPPASW